MNARLFFMEIWKDVIGYEGVYMVSNQGRVKRLSLLIPSKNQFGSCIKPYPEKILSPKLTNNGYRSVGLRHIDEGIGIKYREHLSVHRLVAFAFIYNPDPINNTYINHKDGNKQNNNDWNLEWCTPTHNAQHAIAMGVVPKGSQHKRAKLNETQIPEIRKLLEQGFTHSEIGKKYNVNNSAIWGVKHGRTWKNVK